ncbi:MAG: methylmalonyl-CoA mutase family protein [Cytophagales bacterium]|nr:methylmalonyl-CoA mutase family protein [Cytophagales bacterium]
MENKPLSFSEFGPVSKEEWIEKAKIDLKGADFDKKLVWKTKNGHSIQPFYTQEDLPETDFSSLVRESALTEGAEEVRQWDNYYKIKGESAEEQRVQVQEALKIEANALALDLSGQEGFDFEKVLEGVDLGAVAIAFLNVSRPDRVAFELLDYMDKKALKAEEITGFIDADPLRSFGLTGSFCEDSLKQTANAIKKLAHLPNFSAFSISGYEFLNAGGNHVQELAFVMNKLTDCIDHFDAYGIGREAVLSQAHLMLGIGTDYFHEIAKFRAARIMLTEILKQYETPFDLSKIRITGVSSVWTKTLYDPNVNMLRNTTEAMSAVLGGANALIIDAYNESFDKPDSSGRRISYNISRLLKEESYFDRVLDPSAGSYYLEHLTQTLMDSGRELFMDIESKGGYIQAITSKFIQGLIKDNRLAAEKKIASRRETIVGTNRYPNNLETIEPAKIPGASRKVLKPVRCSGIFEKLRMVTENYVAQGNERPKVLLSLYGHPAMRKARSTFSGDFFGTAGFAIEEKYFGSATEAAQETAQSDASIVVICSSDQDYAETAEQFVKEFKAKAPNKLAVLAGVPGDLEETLAKAGLDDCVHVKTNAVESLASFQRKLGIVKNAD